jgi:sec-independent protein translocase protein TatB
MFEVGFSEIVLIMLIALVVLGPERLPKLAADVGRWMGRARSMARQLRTQLDQEVQLEDMLREQKPSPSPSYAAGAAGAAAGAGATGAAASGVEPVIAPNPFANPPAVGDGAPAIGAPTDELHSHGPEHGPEHGHAVVDDEPEREADLASAPAAWDDPSLAPSPLATAVPAAAGLHTDDSHDGVRRT